jgi:molybdate transport system substrate-binding protein
MRIAAHLALCLGLSWLTAVAAAAAEIKVLTAGAMKAVVVEMAPAFEAATGHKLVIDNDTAGGLAKRIGGGETFDVAVITPSAIDALIKDARVAAGSRVDLAKVGMGVAMKAGAIKPDISTVDAFKATLLAAKSVTYIDPKAGGSSGIYFDKLIERLGIAEPVRAKAKLMAGGYVAELVAKGEVELAIHQISEIVPVAGVVLVGPLPAELQNTTVYAGGISVAAHDADAAKALLAYLASAAAKPVLAKKGMEGM